ncbi:hypothetical protein [Corynebacterium lowii]|uniref:Uncharacterized protein n=1 Tax=Corynebacterium lowii TaxID=1544413 RepID=A0A0Q0UGJ2_9CORY|nr:hypothetical protein [Corynebacterium lowii]KQB87507.1 hypothetical protein Clow_00566 [Corynebacterium lowii]MDP9851898.1 hypothetical protein [Corynebacterium lowii]
MLSIDLSHARRLAAELAHCCAPQPAPAFSIPPSVPATEAFQSQLTQAVDALHQRHDALLAHGRRLAEDSLHAVDRMEDHDSGLAHHLDTQRRALP